MHQNNIYSVMTGPSTHMSSAAVTTCLRPAQDKPNQNTSTDWGQAHDVPFLTKEVLGESFLQGCVS